MPHARLVAIEIERFKSYQLATRVELRPLTVIVGKNNSGKSTLIQALLLLQQTLKHPRSNVPLYLEGQVDAFSLRELTFGWPEANGHVVGPRIGLRWRSKIFAALALEGQPDLANLAKHAGIPWVAEGIDYEREMETELCVETADQAGTTIIERLIVRSFEVGATSPSAELLVSRRTRQGAKAELEWNCSWNGNLADSIEVEVDHFIPYLHINKSDVARRSRQRAWHNGYLLLFAQPLEDLKKILLQHQYLSSSRSLPPSVFRPATVPPDEVGATGEYAAQLLHSRRADVVHYLPPLELRDHEVIADDCVKFAPLEVAVNDVLAALGVATEVSIKDIQDVGFQLLFGKATMQHVGRGLGYLLPIIELGLLADPLRFEASPHPDDKTGILQRIAEMAAGQPLSEYMKLCSETVHLSLEECEAHLHPKVQTRLAHWLVSLAMSGRQLLVETHSDHLVRRLRGLVARAAPGSAVEQWLLDNVSILEVNQDETGRSTIEPMHLTADGSLGAHWPAEFMDEGSEEDSAIFAAGLGKQAVAERAYPNVNFVHGDGTDAEGA